MQIEIWSDVACPWCYVGKRHFARDGIWEAQPVESMRAALERAWAERAPVADAATAEVCDDGSCAA